MSKFCLSKFLRAILHLLWTLEIVSSQNSSIGVTETNEGSSCFFYQQPSYPRDCEEARSQCSTSNVNGVYAIKPVGYPEPFEVYCDNTIDSGGWTVIQRLEDGSTLYNRDWLQYKSGFGFLSHEFWIGNDKLSFLTNQNTYELRIDFTDADGLTYYVTYDRFRISDEYSEYKLTSVGEYKGSEDNITVFLCPPDSEGVVYIFPDCSTLCSCTNGQFSCDNDNECSPNAVCEERNNVLQCYCNEGFTGDGVTCIVDTPSPPHSLSEPPLDCTDVYNTVSTRSGVYKIKPTFWQGDPFDVYCNMTDGGGWTVFQRRVNGSQDFFLFWSDYKNGFGTPEHELWLGNDKLNSVTSQGNYELRIDFVSRDGAPYYAKYSSFSISDERDRYRLSVASYTGTAGDTLTYHNRRAFTTRDRDNDPIVANCATECFIDCQGSYIFYNGAWWYGYRSYSSLNSPYGTGSFFWYRLPNGYCNIKYTEMKVRRIS